MEKFTPRGRKSFLWEVAPVEEESMSLFILEIYILRIC